MRQTGTLVETQVAKAEQAPDRIAFSYLDGECEIIHQLSNLQLHQRAAAIASKLQKTTSPSDRILLLFPQGLAFISAFLGVIYSGSIPVVVAPPRSGKPDSAQVRDIQSIVNATDVSIVLTNDAILDNVAQCFFNSKTLSEISFFSVDEIDNDLMHSWSMPRIENNSVAYLQRTSAGTEIPKFVMISHDNIKNTLERFQCSCQLDRSSRSLSWLPHYHYLGLLLGVLAPIYYGFKGYIASEFTFFQNPYYWLTAISRYGITFSGAPNFAYSLCVEHAPNSSQNFLDLSKWNTAYISAELIKKETIERFFEKFSCCGLDKAALMPIYGLAESAHVASNVGAFSVPETISGGAIGCIPGDADSQNQNGVRQITSISCGLPTTDTSITIAHPKTREKCSDLEIGEVFVKSDCAAAGYWNRPEETARVFGIYFDGSSDGPYMSTGDLGFLKNGEVHIVSKLEGYKHSS